MNRTTQLGIRTGIVLFIGAWAMACGSSSTATGTGGSTGTGTGGSTAIGNGGTPGTGGSIVAGTGGMAATGSGGSAVKGSGGAPGAGGASVALPLCAVAPKNKAVCTPATDTACSNTCGPSKTGFKNCTCNAAVTPPVWDCPKCEFPANGDYSCYKLPTPEVKCPADPTDTSLMLITSNGTCTATACMPCGSATLSSYRDSATTVKIGYCVCVAGTAGSKWSCASTSEWPPQ